MIPGWIPPGPGRQVKSTTPGFTMTRAQACVELSVVPHTMDRWRSQKVGPSWRKAGESVHDPIFYNPVEIARVKAAMAEARAAEPKAAVRKRIAAANRSRPRRRTP